MGASATNGLSLPTLWTDVLAGTLLLGMALSPGLVVATMLALSLFYVAGMFLNDAFDAEYDRARQPHRPIPSGAASEATVFGTGAALMLLGLGLVTAIGTSSGAGGLGGFTMGVALAAASVVYNRWHESNPAEPALMGLCRALVYVVAAPHWNGAVLPACLLAFSYLIGLTYAAKHDHLAKPGSLWPLLFLLAPFVSLLPVALASAIGAALYVALTVTIGLALWLMLRMGGVGRHGACSMSLSGRGVVAFKADAGRRHHIAKPRHWATKSAACDVTMRQRGSLTVWFNEAAIAEWKAEPRMTQGGQSRYLTLATAMALTNFRSGRNGSSHAGSRPPRRHDQAYPTPKLRPAGAVGTRRNAPG